jgi:hypothetical protein
MSMPMPPDAPDPAEAMPSPRPNFPWLAVAANVAILTVSVLVTLLLAEIGFRLVKGISLLDATDWRVERVRTSRIGDRARTDPILGWTLVPNHRTGNFNTIEHGFRRNVQETEVRTGAILAVGDSFTEGFDEVDDASTWPAHLEKIAGLPVVNAGVAGYATDQIILRAEQLIPIVKPKTLIVGFTEVDIDRSSLSEAGAPKPYFTTDNGDLVYHAPGPLEDPETEGVIPKALRAVLGYSALSNHLFSRLTPAFWYPQQASLYEEVTNDPVDITCKLLGRLKRQTDDNQIRLLLFLQYAGELVLEEPVIVQDMQKITDCSRAAGIQVLDQFAPLQALTRNNPDLVALYYTLDDEEFGHMTSKGNEHAAQLLAGALKEAPPPQGQGVAAPPQNLVLPHQDVLRN